MSFSSILGQERPLKFLKALLSTRRIPPALVFYGPEGIGKSLAAKEFAKALACTGPDTTGARGKGLEVRGEGLGTEDDNDLFSSTPPPPPLLSTPIPYPLSPISQPSALSLQPSEDACDSCRSCSQIEKGVHPDVRNVNAVYQALLRDEEAEKQSHIRIETIRAVLTEAQRRPVFADWKVFILHDAHTLVPQAANAMLKLLEEPPEKTLWILLSSAKDLLLPTILSRCQTVEFHPLSPEILHDLLVARSIPSGEAMRLAGMAGGSIQKALRIRTLLDKFSELDPMDPVYPFAVSSILPRDLIKAREQTGLVLEMLLASAMTGWRKAGQPAMRDKLSSTVKKLLRFQKFLEQNVTPGLILETAIMECGSLGVKIYTTQADRL